MNVLSVGVCILYAFLNGWADFDKIVSVFEWVLG